MRESDIKRGFLLAKGASHQSSSQINKEVNWAAMTGMLDLRDIAPITREFAKQGARQLWYRVMVIHIARRDFDSQHFPLVIDHQGAA
ncbi:hypothetical protein SAMN05428978_10024 [Nitrosomonas sp. Nm34]|nr:hypothetical protein SAMN05428978_10024 [Nitrosomonas sp. Nm34]